MYIVLPRGDIISFALLSSLVPSITYITSEESRANEMMNKYPLGNTMYTKCQRDVDTRKLE